MRSKRQHTYVLDPYTMSESHTLLTQQIAALEAALKLPLPKESRRQLETNLRSLRASIVVAGDDVAGDKVGGDKVVGNKIIEPQGTVGVSGSAHVAVGVNLGRILYGADPTDLQREQLTRYLRRLVAKLQRLPLRGLAAHLDEGSGIPMAKVYVMLATENRVIAAEDSASLAGYTRSVEQFHQDGEHDKPLKADFGPDRALPDRAIIAVEPVIYRDRREREVRGCRLYRALLATEAVHRHQHLVLLGDPGGGKSTFLRHLAWALAQRGLDQGDRETRLFRWDDTTPLLPILLPLRTLAGRIAATGATPASVSAALRDQMIQEYDARQPDELLDHALDRGAVLLLFDGLDEVPLEVVSGTSADRLTTLRAVRTFTELHPRVHVVLTCRTRAFDAPLRACLEWPVETLAPFTLGQIRHFVADWYTTLIERGSISRDLGEAQQQTLIAAIAGNSRLSHIASTPLLLTMMTLVLSERGELPRDRPLLYERILEQLLGQWDKQRGGQGLADALNAPNLRSDNLRPILDKLSYEAHLSATSQDGRGQLSTKDLRYALAEFLEKVRIGGAWEAAGRCLIYFNERSGLLQPENDGQYFSFAHLTLQEHGAGRHMLLQPNAVELVMQHRADDRWREPIALGVGVVQKLYPMLADRIDRVLTELIDPDEHGMPKPSERWYRDLLLAAELGVERDWDLLRALISVERHLRDLRHGLIELLGDCNQQLSTAERVRAGELLGQRGDERTPVTIDAWRTELARCNEQFAAPAGYWCYVRPATYRIGGWQKREKTANITLPPFWIARYPITVAQFAPFVDGGYSTYAERWWTPNGWQWKRGQTEPAAWQQPPYAGPNQPVIGVNWYEAMAFCCWLTEQLSAALPEGYVARLPTEAEWEAAAAYNTAMQRCSYPWGEDKPTQEYAIYDACNRALPAPIGCCPSGRATCGAVDMAGNVWELMASSYLGYPEHSNEVVKDFAVEKSDVPWRGGGWEDSNASMLCEERIAVHPDINFNSGGLRVVVAPHLH